MCAAFSFGALLRAHWADSGTTYKNIQIPHNNKRFLKFVIVSEPQRRDTLGERGTLYVGRFYIAYRRGSTLGYRSTVGEQGTTISAERWVGEWERNKYVDLYL